MELQPLHLVCDFELDRWTGSEIGFFLSSKRNHSMRCVHTVPIDHNLLSLFLYYSLYTCMIASNELGKCGNYNWVIYRRDCAQKIKWKRIKCKKRMKRIKELCQLDS
jgi:hypothetical protein